MYLRLRFKVDDTFSKDTFSKDIILPMINVLLVVLLYACLEPIRRVQTF